MQTTEARTLTKEEIEYYSARQIKDGIPVRFFDNGRCMNIVTGERLKAGINVINQIVYWRFTREDSIEIANKIGATTKFAC